MRRCVELDEEPRFAVDPFVACGVAAEAGHGRDAHPEGFSVGPMRPRCGDVDPDDLIDRLRVVPGIACRRQDQPLGDDSAPGVRARFLPKAGFLDRLVEHDVERGSEPGARASILRVDLDGAGDVPDDGASGRADGDLREIAVVDDGIEMRVADPSARADFRPPGRNGVLRCDPLLADPFPRGPGRLDLVSIPGVFSAAAVEAHIWKRTLDQARGVSDRHPNVGIKRRCS